jgi:uncharacterized sulfatase
LIGEYGLEESLTQFEGLGDRILPLLDPHNGQPVRKHALGSDNLGRGRITWMDRSQVTSAFVARAKEFIQQAEAAGRPFYVNLWPDDVHSPFFPPGVASPQQTKREQYYAVLKAMDEQLSPLLDYIRGHDRLRENTIIALASDNGPEPGAGSAGIFRGHKGQLYEGGIRSPLIVWAPGLMPAGVAGSKNETTWLASVDLMRSMLSLALVEPPAEVRLDGEDLSQTLIGKARQTRKQPLFWNRPPDRPGPEQDRWPDLAVREGDWKLLVMSDGSRPQLYDLRQDPRETRNLAAQHPHRVKELHAKLSEWWERYGR